MKCTSRHRFAFWVLVVALFMLPSALTFAPWPLRLDSALGSGTAAQARLKGDAASGRTLVEVNKCPDCHRIEERGSRVGPDLSDIAAARSGEQLQRAIVAPDEEVIPENRQIRIVTEYGTTVSGKLLNQSARSTRRRARRNGTSRWSTTPRAVC
jgi:putative heme-binding domain-containing protein